MIDDRDTRALALVEGGPLPEPAVATLGEALRRAAALRKGGSICHIAEDGSERQQPYPDLLEDAARIRAGMCGAGLRPRDQVVLQLAHAPDLLAAFWACVLGGFVPVPVSANPPANGPLSAAALVEGVAGMLDRAWILTAGSPPSSARRLGPVEALRRNAPNPDPYPVYPDDTAALLLTSGSTGLPKAVTLTHRNILSRSAATAQVRGLGVTNRSFNWMPLDHVGGLVMFHARDVFLGCDQVHARMEWVLADPLRWLEAISRHRCDTTWAPNFAFNLILDRADEIAGRSWDLSCLRYIMNGGESISARTVRRFLDLLASAGLPATAMHPGWGMSETSSGVADGVFSVETSSDEDRFVPTGTPHPGVSIRVVGGGGDVLPEGVVGRLQVSGAPITSGYHNNPEQNRQSFTQDGWFKTGDLAFVESGVLTVTGRVDDIIDADGVTCHGHEIEAVVEELHFVDPTYTVACQVKGVDGTPDRLAVFFHPRSGTAGDEVLWQIREHVLARLGIEPGHVVPVEKNEVPKTGVGKLKRSVLARRFEIPPAR